MNLNIPYNLFLSLLFEGVECESSLKVYKNLLGANQVQPVSEIENAPFYAGSGHVHIVQIWLSP